MSIALATVNKPCPTANDHQYHHPFRRLNNLVANQLETKAEARQPASIGSTISYTSPALGMS